MLLIARIHTGFVAGAVVATAASTILGNQIAEQTPDERTLIKSGNELSPRTPPGARQAVEIGPWLDAVKSGLRRWDHRLWGLVVASQMQQYELAVVN